MWELLRDQRSEFSFGPQLEFAGVILDGQTAQLLDLIPGAAYMSCVPAMTELERSAAKSASAARTNTLRHRVARQLDHAFDAEELAAWLVTKLRERVSQPSVELSRDDCQSALQACRALDTAQERIRILRGVPLPGNRRPLPEQPKAKKKVVRAFLPIIERTQKGLPADRSGEAAPFRQNPAA